MLIFVVVVVLLLATALVNKMLTLGVVILIIAAAVGLAFDPLWLTFVFLGGAFVISLSWWYFTDKEQIDGG